MLLALIDLCVESGHPPSVLTTPQLARRVVELYWPQSRPFETRPDQTDRRTLLQNRGGQASVVRLISAYQQAHPDELSPPRRGPAGYPPAYQALLDAVEWVLVEYPLPRLQRVAGGEERFLYVIDWGEDVSKAAFLRYKQGAHLFADFDNRILLQPDAAASLIALSSVLRPLVQQQWQLWLQAQNQLPESALTAFLFGAERAALGPVREPLRALQGGRCFYCTGPLSSGPTQVDHFLPWARYPDNGLDNLVLAHDRCNHNKLHFLADQPYAERWARRIQDQGADLDAIAELARWPRDLDRTLGVVASTYQGLPTGVRLWQGVDRWRPLGDADLEAVHGFGRGLLRALSARPLA